ncbi:MAG: ATP-binding protein [Clostridia bacterium]|nr:ATP-binding protein [Clostridia bacterium]MDE7349341.1 ATP-binding protein [Clostridia bacterium]
MVARKEFLDVLESWKHEKVIKVVTGIRRCGKSTLLKQFQDKLKAEGVSDEQIISLNLEELENEELTNYKSLYEYITQRLCRGKYTYIFLDEIQTVENFQKAIDSIYVKDNVDVYITGSNAYLLSGELATLLSGRCVEISMLPLSFKEYCQCVAGVNDEEKFNEYLQSGGFPLVANMDNRDSNKVNTYLEVIFNAVVIDEKYKRRNADKNKRKVSDITLLRTISKYLASVIGSPVSAKSIADYLSSNGRKISSNTVEDYIEALTESYIFYPVERYDISGKVLLKRNLKYYIVDLGLKRHLVPKQGYDVGYAIENIVYFELLRRGYKVNVGKFGNTEVDFVAQKDGVVEYYQVSASMLDKSVFEREIAPLKNIKDMHTKKILTLNKFGLGNYDGIVVENIIDWLKSN